MCVNDISGNMVEHVVHQILSGDKIEKIIYFPNCQIKDYTCDSQGTCIGRSCTQLLWSNKVINDVIKKGNEDVNQDVLVNICDTLVTDFPTQRKDEQVSLVSSKINRKLVQSCELEKML